MTPRRIIAAFMAVCLLFLSGCNHSSSPSSETEKSSQDNHKTVSNTARVLFSSKDSLDPYAAVTEQNLVLSNLIFEPLVILDNDYEVIYGLAESATVKKKQCTVTLRSATFSDGSSVTPQDIVFSFNKAKKSKTRHSAALRFASSAKAIGENSVVFTLTKQDPYFVHLLTFPILKKGSDKLKDRDNQALCPIGAGRYIFDNEKENLKLNPYYYGKKSAIETIETVDAPDEESVNQAIKADMVDFYFTDLSNNIIPKMNGNAADISQTRLVFIGVNPKHPQLKNSLFRQAISSLIDRQTICNTAYFSKATPAIGPFPSSWKPAKGYMNIETFSNLKTACNNIEMAGFTDKNKNGYYLLHNRSPITFSLLVNKENSSRVLAAEQISKSAKKAGLKINIHAVTKKQYFTLLKKGSYDLYLGEVRMEENMDLGGLTQLSSVAALTGTAKKNISKNSSASASSDNKKTAEQSSASLSNGSITLTTKKAYQGFYEGIYSLQDLITAFTAELPVIPVCFKNGLVIYSNRFSNGLSPTRSDLFYGIQLLK